MSEEGTVEVAPGRRLFVRREGEGEGTPVLLLHGFSGCGEAMEPAARALPAGTRRVFVDLVGHGRSDSPDEPSAYRMETCVRDLLSLLDLLGEPRVHVLGYSMGARAGLALAAAAPARVASLLLVAPRAGIEDPVARASRVREDEALARRIREQGVAWFVDHWLGLPLFASQRRLGPAHAARARAQRLRCDVRGLAGSLRGMGVGAQPPLFPALSGLGMPVLLVTGGEDGRFTEAARELEARLPRATRVELPGAGHAAHLEDPRGFAAALRRFGSAHGFWHVSSVPDAAGGGTDMEVDWKSVREYEDIRFEGSEEGIARITIARPEVRNAFRPKTLFELIDAFTRAREDSRIGVILFTGEGPEAFCSGGDQKVRGDAGYVDDEGIPRLNALDLQRVIRTLPKPVIALVAGYAIGGGHVLHLICDLTIAADNARFGQTGPRVGSFDAGFGASYLARVVGQKKAREIWYLCEQYDAREALAMGLVNRVVPLAELERTGVEWARRILCHSPTAIRCLKAAFNADCDGQAGLQELAGHATQLFYMTEEAQEGRNAFLEKRPPDFRPFPWRP